MTLSKLLILETISKQLWYSNFSATKVTDYEMGDPGSVPMKFRDYVLPTTSFGVLSEPSQPPNQRVHAVKQSKRELNIRFILEQKLTL
jgi:hypothetical protein